MPPAPMLADSVILPATWVGSYFFNTIGRLQSVARSLLEDAPRCKRNLGLVVIFNFKRHPEHLHYRLDGLIAKALIGISILVWLALWSAREALRWFGARHEAASLSQLYQFPK
ncbi:hypothetical protein IPC1138_13800 [Pseudomonas aeruginosa]|nr:hypothetical protein IPC1138_13800 [Pseudomonas aeruginosa]RUF23717.1 hypothetical protein IPC1111_13265 [Pseudomonas aeruginosa]